MHSRSQTRALTVTGIVALMMMLMSMFSLPAITFADSIGTEPPHDPYPTDTLEIVVPPDTTDGFSGLPVESDISFLDVVVMTLEAVL
jgi:hypothetical protein